jgi:hypothetical protein
MKDKVAPVHAMKTNGGRSGVAPLILNLGTRWKIVANFTLQSLYLQEITTSLIE